jgi:hypothetical protein
MVNNDPTHPTPRCFRAWALHLNRFDQPHIVGGERKLFSFEIVFHMLLVRGAGQREHSDLDGKPKDDLGKTGP